MPQTSMIDLIHGLFRKIGRPVNLMEVCGTHTVAIFKHGIRSLLPEGLRLLSGPGCPVCVTSVRDVDRAIAFAMCEGTVLATFGDMMRVPGGRNSLSDARAEGGRVRIVYSPREALTMARGHSDSRIVLFSAGFETTAPSVAATIFEAEQQEIPNFFVYSVHKLVPPALGLLLGSDEVRIDGFLLPGNVTAIIGTEPYAFIAEKFRRPGVVTGFGPEDILSGIVLCLRQIAEGRSAIEVQYGSVVKPEGNKRAIGFMHEHFEPCDSYWRGIGLLPGSGLRIRDKYAHRDAEKVFDLTVPDHPEPKGCLCGLVLRGIKIPPECPLFGKSCTPERPVGACMVSTEGSCAAYYKYSGIAM